MAYAIAQTRSSIQEQGDGVLSPPPGYATGWVQYKALASHDAVVLSLSPPPTSTTAVRFTRFKPRFKRQLRKSEKATASMLVTPMRCVIITMRHDKIADVDALYEYIRALEPP